MKTDAKIFGFGNCQAHLTLEGIERSAQNFETRTVLLASTLTHLASPDPAALLADFPEVPEESEASLFLSRTLRNQFVFAGVPLEARPDRIVLSLFHDASPLFRHHASGSVFYAYPAEAERLGLAEWLSRECSQIEADSNTYFERYAAFLALIRSRYPETPILLMVRCRSLPAYAPTPYSYLSGWSTVESGLNGALERFRRDFGPFSTLELDSVVGGYVRRTGSSISGVFPTVLLNSRVSKELEGCDEKWRMERVNARDFNSLLQRDIEHPCQAVWDRVGEIAAQWCETGRVEYDDLEKPLDPSFSPTLAAGEVLATQHRTLKGNSDVMVWQHFIENLIYTLPEDRSHLIEDLGTVAPQDKYLLRAIRAYALLNPSLSVLRFLEDYLAKLEPSSKGNRDTKEVLKAITRLKRSRLKRSP